MALSPAGPWQAAHIATLPSPADALPWAWLRVAVAASTTSEANSGTNVDTAFVARPFMNNPTFLSAQGSIRFNTAPGQNSATNSSGSLANPSGGHVDEASGREL